MAKYRLTGPDGSAYNVTAPDTATESDVWAMFQKSMGGQAPAAASDPAEGLDYSKPIDQLRGDIAKLPETSKEKALNLWADRQIAQEREKGFRPLPNVAEGIPIVGGLLDEINAGADAALHTLSFGRTGAPYDEALALQRARARAADAANPALAAGGKLAAGIVTGAPVARAAGAVLPAAESVLGRVAQGVAGGAVLGGVEGYTRGDGDVGNRLDTAGQGAAFGGAVGGALPIAATGATRAVGAYMEHINPHLTRLRYGPDAAADEILANRIASEGSTPAQKRLDLQQGQNNARLQGGGATASRATLPETIADTSPAMGRLLGSANRSGGEAGNFTRQTLEGRQRGPANAFAPRTDPGPQGQYERVLDSTERALLIRQAGTARQNDTRLMREQAVEARRLYGNAERNQDAFDIGPAIQQFDATIAEYPTPFARILTRARQLFTERGTAQNQPFLVANNIRRFDAAKKSLDDMIDEAQRAGRNNVVRELTTFKENLLDSVHGGYNQAGEPLRNRAYWEARRAWGSAAENRQAIELGRNALNEGSEVSVEQYLALTPGQQRLFRIGFLGSMRNNLGRSVPGTDVTRTFQQRRVQDIMREIIPRSQGRRDVYYDRPERYGDILRREQRMVETRNRVLGNSQTAERISDDLEFTGNTLRTMWDRSRSAPGLFNIGLEAIGVGIQRVFGYRQDVALALARRLLETDPTMRNQILSRLARRGGPDRFAQFAAEMDRAAAALIPATTPALVESGAQ